MCGFAFMFDKYIKPPKTNYELMKKMISKISYRGPDYKTIKQISPNATIGFVRLSMVDENSSFQPIFNEKKNIALLFNGEIYNYKTLTQNLKEKGHIFRTNGDGEVIVHLYEDLGLDLFPKLDGMYSICIINLNTGETIIARDEFGIKPLFYYYNSNNLLIASEMKSILNVMPEKNTINTFAIDLYMNCRFIPSPHTIYNEIFKLSPGEVIVFDKNIKIVNRKKHREIEESVAEVSDISSLFVENITEMVDEKIGAFLSGGIDSSLILSIANNYQKMRSFSVGYDTDFEYDELNIAKQFSEEIGTLNYQKIIKSLEVKKILEKSIYHLDEPLFSSVSVCTLELAKIAKEKGVKGVLVGDGSDELFFGYKYIHDAAKFKQLDDKYNSYFNSLGWINYKDRKKIFNDGNIINENDFWHYMFKCTTNAEVNNYYETVRNIEMYIRLPDYHLTRVDRLTMAYGIEARVPYLRRNFVKTIKKIPIKNLINPLDTKIFLKQTFKDYTTDFLYRRIKQPFTSPIKYWIESVLWNDIREIFNENNIIYKCYLDKKQILSLLDNYHGTQGEINKVWGVYILLKWAQNI